jgi:hypothetical protein
VKKYENIPMQTATYVGDNTRKGGEEVILNIKNII